MHFDWVSMNVMQCTWVLPKIHEYKPLKQNICQAEEFDLLVVPIEANITFLEGLKF